MDLISLADIKWPMCGWGASGEPDPLSTERKLRGSSHCSTPTEIPPFFAELSASDPGPEQLRVKHLHLLSGIVILLVCPGRVYQLGYIFS